MEAGGCTRTLLREPGTSPALDTLDAMRGSMHIARRGVRSSTIFLGLALSACGGREIASESIAPPGAGGGVDSVPPLASDGSIAPPTGGGDSLAGGSGGNIVAVPGSDGSTGTMLTP